MDEPRSKRPKPDDVPVIGDYSAAQNARLRGPAAPAPSGTPATSPPAAPARSPQPPRSGRKVDERVTLDPRDVRRYQRLASERERKGRTATWLRYAPVVAVVAAIVVVYWNFDSLRGMTVGFSTGLGGRGAQESGEGGAPSGTEPASAPVEAPVVVGDDAALNRDEDPAPIPEAAIPEAATPEAAIPDAPAAPAPVEPPPEAETAAGSNLPVEEPVAGAASAGAAAEQPAPPAAPAEPERFEFGVAVNSVSEGDAAAAVLVLRGGGQRGVSSITWWTTSGTATAGVDYADLGRVVLQFPAGAQNRTIRIPIVGDGVVEGPETFSVHLAAGEDANAAEAQARAEVIINDDD
jgi:hypothetical protein